MSCKDKISNLCADPILSTCVDHNAPLGVNTNITDECVNQSAVNTDLYAITDKVIAGLDNSELASDCMTIPSEATTSEIIAIYESKICELNQKVTDLEQIDYSEIDITSWGLTIPDCIVDSCSNPPTTLSDLLQIFMNQRNCT